MTRFDSLHEFLETHKKVGKYIEKNARYFTGTSSILFFKDAATVWFPHKTFLDTSPSAKDTSIQLIFKQILVMDI